VKARVTIRPQYAYVPPIFGNAVELEQAFVNLILNALHHMKGTHRRRGLLDITLSVAASLPRPIQIRFRDTGPGIHSRFLDTTVWGEERIFHPLFTTKKAGTGMGLYITRGLIGNHRGKVSIEKTAIMAGTTVLVELPQQGGQQDA
jgi:signal transduction histidine kinase